MPFRISARPVLMAASLAVALIGGAVTLQSPGSHEAPAPTPLSQRLGSQTYGLAIPLAWLAAPIPGLHENDVLDMLGTRAGERATAQDVATGLRVMTIDDHTLVVELTAAEASAISAARARGLALIPIVRSAQ